MPTYRNSNPTVVRYSTKHGVTNFMPGINTPVSFFIPHEELNLELISDEPLVPDPIVWSGKITDGTINIPYFRTIIISAITENSAYLYFGDGKNGVPIETNVGFKLEVPWRTVNRVRVEGTATVVVEQGG